MESARRGRGIAALFAACTDKISKSDMTKVSMLAQDNAGSAQYLSYVIDAAIRHLQKTS